MNAGLSSVKFSIVPLPMKPESFSYSCMWRTTNAFITRNWPVPQFYGKWPFVRFLGMQEPASVLFSLFNFLSHFWMIRKFREDVRKDSPMFYVWHVFCAVRRSLVECKGQDIKKNFNKILDLPEWLDVVCCLPHQRFSIH